ncbi:hypothetical protein BO85DRAFT_511136 [Aspergillus piperis CBS 112811]|uniref:TNT domain-containing protein n=1 Tax=Aspergillus piperis CBS 112811 TaxID=1448313 RepID=A0A8G1R5M8_9EURO|nr:hypothetical protein BO85DRAFT_511136 [Aspergillus piperis CBS 112811]RAH60013.1 hypothetical protein BO85DRAFT_511136 [Aspergillus piperis CBS 112811]
MVCISRALLMLPFLGSVAYAQEAANVDEIGIVCPNMCGDITPDPAIAAQKKFYCKECVCENRLLGLDNPKFGGNWTEIFKGWDWYGGLCPRDWLFKWGHWDVEPWQDLEYPPNDGFKTGSLPGGPRVGSCVDRFGSPYGGFLAPLGTKYSARAIPPKNLIKYPNSPQFNYYVYKVKQPLIAQKGDIAPWFGQPGGGTQYYVASGLENLVKYGVLEPTNVEECPKDGVVEWDEGADAPSLEAWESLEPAQGDPMFYH